MQGVITLDYIVTQNELLNINKTIITNADTFKDSNTLLDDYVVKKFNVLDERRILLMLFADFKSARYFTPSINV